MQPCQIRPRELARIKEIQTTLSPGLCKQRAKARAKVLPLFRSPFLRLMNQRRPLGGVTVVRNGRVKKTVGQTKPEVGKHRAGDWTGPVVTTAEELDKLASEKQPALPSSSSEAELMWSLLAARDNVDCMVVFNYQPQKDFVSATEQALGIMPQLMTVPLYFSNGLRFAQRFALHGAKICSRNLAARLLVGDFGALWRWWRRAAKEQRNAAADAVLDDSDHLPEFCLGLVWQL